jgi:uncharacterized membrane protein YhhN
VSERRLPPVQQLGVVSMILTIVSVIWLASYIPKHPPLTVSVVLMILAGVVMATNLTMLSRVREFAWQTFRAVAGWTLVAYIVIAGMLEFVFLYDHVRGSVLLLMTLSLVSFAVNVPLLLGFGVARYQ